MQRTGRRSFVIGSALVLGLGGCFHRGPQASRPARALPIAAPAASAGADTWTSPELGVSLDKPHGTEWQVVTGVISPDGRPLPLVVSHEGSGAQIVVQVSEPVQTPRAMAELLHGKLGEEPTLELGDAGRVDVDSGTDAYGFTFHVDGEANGRVAIIRVGEHLVLVVASWPEDAGERIVHDVDGLVRSVREAAGAIAPAMRPDKA